MNLVLSITFSKMKTIGKDSFRLTISNRIKMIIITKLAPVVAKFRKLMMKTSIWTPTKISICPLRNRMPESTTPKTAETPASRSKSTPIKSPARKAAKRQKTHFSKINWPKEKV